MDALKRSCNGTHTQTSSSDSLCVSPIMHELFKKIFFFFFFFCCTWSVTDNSDDDRANSVNGSHVNQYVVLFVMHI